MPRNRIEKNLPSPAPPTIGSGRAPSPAPASPGARQAPSPAPQGGGSELPPRPVPRDVFGATDIPAEPSTAGIPFGPGDNGAPVIPEDPDMLIRAILEALPNYAADLIGLLGD